jgi:hypothetical protein
VKLRHSIGYAAALKHAFVAGFRGTAAVTSTIRQLYKLIESKTTISSKNNEEKYHIRNNSIIKGSGNKLC